MYRFTKADYSKIYLCLNAFMEAYQEKTTDDEKAGNIELVEADKKFLDDLSDLRDKVAAHICNTKK